MGLNFNLPQFDYYGDDMSIVTIFNDSATECNYPKTDPPIFFETVDFKKFRVEDFMIEFSSME